VYIYVIDNVTCNYTTELGDILDVLWAATSAHRGVGVFSEPFKLPLNDGIIALGVDGLSEGVAGDRPGVEIV
jgi:hypothetical protein